MSESVIKQVLKKISNRKSGWCFSRNDFARIESPEIIDVMLSRLAAQEKIRRLGHGLYDNPRKGTLIKERLPPDLDQAAHAIARKFGWRIQPNSETALNILGLSSQVPGKWVYLSDGPTKEFEIGDNQLRFKNTSLKLAGIKHEPTALTVIALKALGKERVDDGILDQIRKRWRPQQKKRMLDVGSGQTAWIYECIKKIAREPDDE